VFPGGLAHVKSLILCEKDDPDQSTNMEERKHSTDHDPGSFVAAASIVAQVTPSFIQSQARIDINESTPT
jgi:hypothetical protein